MGKIHHRPSILVRAPSNADTSSAKLKEGTSTIYTGQDSKSTNLEPPNRSWARYIWDVVCEFYVHWKLLSYVPFDLLYGSFDVSPTSTPGDNLKSAANRVEGPSSIGQIALHPNLPLLAVASTRSAKILFYSTETSQNLGEHKLAYNGAFEQPQRSENSELISSASHPYVTCLQFSKGAHVAAGLSNGTVQLLERNFSRMVKSDPNLGKSHITPDACSIRLLPLADWSLYIKIVGRITNLAFPPNPEEDEEGVWLAISTERSGIWMWNEISRKVLRIVTTTGLSEGCLHWIGNEETPVPKPTFSGLETHEEKYLRRPEMNKWSDVFGTVEEMRTLDSSFSSPFWNPSTDHGPVPRLRVTSSGSVSCMPDHRQNLGPPQSRKGQSLLICGSRDGSIRVDQLWHSTMMMHIQNSTDLPLWNVTTSGDNSDSASGSGPKAISQVLVRPLGYNLDEVQVPLLLAFEDQGFSLLQAFTMSLPLPINATVGVAVSMANSTDAARGCLQGVVNQLSPFRVQRRWPFFSPVFPKSTEPAWLITGTSMDKASLISASYLRTANLILTTLCSSRGDFGNSKSSQCTLFSQDPFSESASLQHMVQIRPAVPKFPEPAQHEEDLTPRSREKRYYADMLLRAGVRSPASKIPLLEDGKLYEPAQMSDHVINCGQVTWGKGRYGRDLGAFLYQPCSLLDEGLAVAIFELKE